MYRNAIILLCALQISSVSAQRAIPDNNLAYPVQIEAGVSSGTGFYINIKQDVYLVTAKHVLEDLKTGQLHATTVVLRSVSPDPTDKAINVLSVDLQKLDSAGRFKRHMSVDVAVAKIGHLAPQGDDKKFLNYFEGVRADQIADKGIVGANEEIFTKYDQVNVSNDVYVFGYPSSIGLKDVAQIDPARPLLRKGIVAGKNDARTAIIIDCQVFPGNSGGPVIEVDDIALEKRLRLIGVLVEYVPFDNSRLGLPLRSPTVLNSGYSVVIPMDYVIELLD